MQKWIHTFFGLCIAFITQAQIQAPELLCVTTLFDGSIELTWNAPPPNSCGSFNGYRIYASQNPSAVFSLLTIVTNPAQTTYTHTNANGATNIWYYYMTTDLNCPNEVPLQSNTLDNLDPETPDIVSVSVTGDDNVEVIWEVSTSLETSGYVIYWETIGGFIAIDTVWGRTSTFYEHTGASPSTQTEAYTIAAIDACGNSGIINPDPQRTLLLQTTIDRCNQSVSLSWGIYENWSNPINLHLVRVSINGAPFERIATLSGDVFEYTYENATDGDEVCFTAQTIESVTSSASMTNQVCHTLDIVEPMDFIYLTNVSVNNDNQVELSWMWDIDADLLTSTIAYSDSGINYSSTITQPPNFPLLPVNFQIDTATSIATTNSIFYRIESADSCNDVLSSNYGKTIFMAGEPLGNFQNRIAWTPFELEYGTINTYDIYRKVNDEITYVTTVNGATLTYIDEVDPSNPLEKEVCYFVIAQATVELPNGQAFPIESQSNTACIRQLSTIYIPNAFAPLGVNNEFKPLLVFAENSTFSMVIFNRWGRKVFESTNPEIGWDGRLNGRILQQGIYTYVVNVTQLDGERVEQKGTVMLLK